MKKNLYKILLLVTIISATMFANSRLIPRINLMRDTAGLTRNLPLENAPPQFVVAVNLLGGLRSILINMLWMRTIKLREQGKFFEMSQLYKWICELEPQIEDIWTHNAWNMAYNISYEMPFDKDRWRWIKKAIRLLRDQGLKYNSKSAKIRKEIAWIYSHKIGQNWDDMHFYYKKQLALEMNGLVNNIEDLKEMETLQKTTVFLKNNPEIDKIFTDLQYSGIHNYTDFRHEFELSEKQSEYDKDVLYKISLLLRRDNLQKVYKFDVSEMIKIMNKFGPLDWRLPDTHAIYWAYTAKKFADKKNMILYDRIIYIAMQATYRRGKLFLVKDGEDYLYITGPDKNFIDTMYQVYMEIIEYYKDSDATIKNIKSSYFHYLSEVIILLYASNDTANAKKYFDIIKKDFPNKIKEDSYIRYAINEFKITAETGNYDNIKGLLYTLVKQAYWNLSLGNEQAFTGYIKLATMLRNEYTKIVSNQARLKLPTINEIKRQALKDAQNFPRPLKKSLDEKVRTE